jgi:hypothetical protein
VKKSLLMLPLVLLVTALALTACGGGGSSSSGGSSDETAISEAIEKSATTTDPSKCAKYQTEEFNEQDEHTTSNALKACEEAAEESETPAEAVNVSNIKVNGETATAKAEVEGSSLNGQTVEIEMANEEGTWKLNKFLGFANYDGQGLAEAFEEELKKEEGITASLAKCVGEGFSELSQQEAEAVVFAGETEGLEELAESCQSA